MKPLETDDSYVRYNSTFDVDTLHNTESACLTDKHYKRSTNL